MIQPSINGIPYIKSVDGLRGIAILMVLFDHGAPWRGVHDIAEFGRTGLLLFFMLSGYLITSVLVKLKNQITATEIVITTGFRNFYTPHALRILPIYTFALVFAASLHNSVRHYFFYHLLFLQYFTAAWAPIQGIYQSASHLWSLAVEEQFYLVWAPLVLLIFDFKVTLKICIVAILISIAFKSWCLFDHVSLLSLAIFSLTTMIIAEFS